MKRPLSAALFFAIASTIGAAHQNSPPLPHPVSVMPNIVQPNEPSSHKNLLYHIGNPFSTHLPRWDQRHLLNDTAYAALLALSIDASTYYCTPIVLDPDSTTHGPVDLKNYIKGLNHRNYIEYWKNPFYQAIFHTGKNWHPFEKIELQQMPNNEKTKDTIKAAIDKNQAVIFTYNFILDDCTSPDEFFRLKFNLADEEVYKDDSSYDTLRDGEHTMCIVGYDDRDQTFLVQDSRSATKQLALPGLKIFGNDNGTIKITQNLDYAHYFYRSNKLSTTYRHEFFTVKAGWIKGDIQPPLIAYLKMETHHGPAPSPSNASSYRITAQITDNVKVADGINTTISMPGLDKPLHLHNVFKDGIMSLEMPILDKGSMSDPMAATITVMARDTSGNQSEQELHCHFAYGLPQSILPKAGQTKTAVADLLATPVKSGLAPNSPFAPFSLPPASYSLHSDPPFIDLVEAYLPNALRGKASEWNQGNGSNCVAYGSLAAMSITTTHSRGYEIVFDPDSTLQTSSTVPHYITKIVSRGYVQLWSPCYWLNTAVQFYFPLSGVSLQQIPNNSSAKQAIKDALKADTPVVFTFHYWSGGESELQNFWHGPNQIFTGINANGVTVSPNNGHTMCVIGYDDDDGTFIVQNSWGEPTNRPHGTLKIPQDLLWERWHYHNSTWPATIAGGMYRFDFYKLTPNWSYPDTIPPTISDGELDLFGPNNYHYSGPPILSFYVGITDNVKVAEVSASLEMNGLPNDMYGETSGTIWTYVIPYNFDDPSRPASGTITITATDTSGNVSQRSFFIDFTQFW